MKHNGKNGTPKPRKGKATTTPASTSKGTTANQGGTAMGSTTYTAGRGKPVRDY